jgi:alpha-tubulin suppressor-like RCC1 family protein
LVHRRLLVHGSFTVGCFDLGMASPVRHRFMFLWLVGALAAAASCIITLSVAPTPVLAETATTSMSVGNTHSCAVLADRTVSCWGRNLSGELGRGFTSPTEAPGPVTGISDAVEVAAGQFVSCARHATGAVSCWGNDAYEMLGDGVVGTASTTTPHPVVGITDAVAITVGIRHACAALGDGTVSCWGWNSSDQLGRDIGSVEDPTPTTVPGLNDVVMVDASYEHNCALTSTGEVWCWGRGTNGQLGSGTSNSFTPLLVAEVSDAIALGVGFTHSCAVTGSGAVWCWGGNGFGQLGRGNTTTSATVEAVPGITDAADIAAGFNHNCVVHMGGTVSCWGQNDEAQLGQGFVSNIGVSSPTLIAGLIDRVQADAGGATTCAVTAAGAADCWGSNTFDQAEGTGVSANPNPFVTAAVSPAGVTGGSNNLCRWSAGGAVQCVGANSTGILLDGTTNSSSSYVTLPGVTVDALVVGTIHACGVRNQKIKCWGSDTSGQLGDGLIVSGPNPVTPVFDDDTTELEAVTDIASDGRHTCAVDSGSVYCWGLNLVGQSGSDPLAGTTLFYVTQVAGVPAGATRVAVSDEHSCAIANGGEVWCWGGGNEGELGDGLSTSGYTPVRAGTITDATDLAVGRRHSCAITGTGTVECWGLSPYTGGTSSPTPAAVAGISTAVQLTAGETHTCVRLADATVTCWGSNSSGELGDGTITSRSTPAPVVGISGAIAIGGENATCATTSTSTRCWGRNVGGELGDFPYVAAPEPAALGSSVLIDNDIDGIADSVDNCPTVPNADQVDTNNDGEGDACDPDDDGDGDLDGSDNCPLIANADQANTDGDSQGDACDPDDDNDGILDGADNCPLTANADQADADEDGIGDVCDPTPDPTPTTVFSSITPVRLVETRSGAQFQTVDDLYEGDGPIATNTVYRVQIAGRGSIDPTATAAVLNLTTVAPIAPGFLTIYPCGTQPLASGINYTTGAVVNNEIITKLSPTGEICIYASAQTHLVIDAVGSTPATSPYVAVTPARIVETRTGPDKLTIDHLYEGDGPIPTNTAYRVQIAGRGGIDPDATAAILNLTTVAPIAAGFLTIYPCGTQPLASGINYTTGAVVNNEIITKLSPTGEICIYASAQTHLVIDAAGYIPPGVNYTPLTPARIVETRSGAQFQTVDDLYEGDGPIPTNTVYRVQIAGRGGIDPDATAAILNLTTVAPIAPGFLTIYPCGTQPLASGINYTTGAVVNNEIITKLSPTGEICIYASAQTHLVIDATGWL